MLTKTARGLISQLFLNPLIPQDTHTSNQHGIPANALIKKLNYNITCCATKLAEYKIEPKVLLHPFQGGRETVTNLQWYLPPLNYLQWSCANNMHNRGHSSPNWKHRQVKHLYNKPCVARHHKREILPNDNCQSFKMSTLVAINWVFYLSEM